MLKLAQITVFKVRKNLQRNVEDYMRTNIISSFHQQLHVPLLSHGCIQQHQTKYYRKIYLWGIRGKARKCPIGTVSVCLKEKKNMQEEL